MSVNKENILTYELACELFKYEKETGFLFWKTARNNRKLNKRIGSKHPDGHLLFCIGMGGKKYNFFVHRVVWLINYGVWPHPTVDHINCNPEDNRIENLRIATRQQNCNNRPKVKKEGFKGVYVCTPGKSYRARMEIDGKMEHIGLFKTAIEAHEAYIKFAKKHHGEFARG
jgi:hypothetical protein